MALQLSFRSRFRLDIFRRDFPTESEATSVIDDSKHLLRTNTMITLFALSITLFPSEVGHSWNVLGW
jgi:hypothetical protein